MRSCVVRMTSSGFLTNARRERHHLSRGAALKTVTEAHHFITKLGIVMRTPHPYLPSLFTAAGGRPFRAQARGFGQWPEHAWWWDMELAKARDIILTRVLLGRTTFVSNNCWAALDAAVRATRIEDLDSNQRAIIRLLGKHGSMYSDRLRTELGLGSATDARQFQKARCKLENVGLVTNRPRVVGAHKHVAELQLWITRFPKPLCNVRSFGPFVWKAIRAGEPVPAKEVLRWFAWPKADVDSALRSLVAEGYLSDRSGILVTTRPP